MDHFHSNQIDMKFQVNTVDIIKMFSGSVPLMMTETIAKADKYQSGKFDSN